MDDVLASQQLVEEETRAEHAASDVLGTSPAAATANLGREQPIDLTTQPEPPTSQQTIPSSPPSFAIDDGAPPSPFITDEDAQPSSHEVEVPDSQLAPKSKKQSHLPMTPIATSSFAIPASVHEATIRKRGKSSKKRIHNEVDTSITSSKQSASANKQVNGMVETAEVSPAPDAQSLRRRKRSYATPPSTAMGSQRAHATSEQGQSARQLSEHVVTDEEAGTPRVEGSNKKKRKKRSLARKSLAESVPTGSIEDEGMANASDDNMSPRSKRLEEKLRRLKKSKPSTSTERSADEDVNASGSVETSGMSKKRKRKGRAPDVEADDSVAIESDVDGPPADVEQDPGPDGGLAPEEDLSDEHLLQHTTPKPKIHRRPKSTTINTPARRYSRKSNVDTTIMAADRELNNSRMLNHPPMLPTGGKFTGDEDEVLRRAIQDHQQRKDLSTRDLVAVIQWTDPSLDHAHPRKKNEWTQAELEEEADSKELWDEIKNTEPQLRRKLEIVKRHVQARYHTFKSGGWTEDEDDDLRRLMKQYPNQWKTMSLMMGDRSAPDIQNRWKDYVQHSNRNTGAWTLKEEELLLSALVTVIQRDEDERDSKGLPSIAEYSNKDINWAEVCTLMDNVRSRLQCTVKWTQMKERDASANVRPVYRRGRTPDPTRPAAPTPKKRKRNEAQSASEDNGDESVPQKKRRRPRKSQAQPASGDEVEECVPQTKRKRPRKSEARPASAEEEDVTVEPKKRRKSHTDKSEARDSDAELAGIGNDRLMSTKISKKRKRRSSKRSNQKAAEVALEESNGPDIAASAEDDDGEQATAGPAGVGDEKDPAASAEDDYGEEAEEAEEDHKPEAPNTPQQEGMSPIPERPVYSSITTPQQTPSSPEVRSAGVARMKWGDKFDVIETIASLDIMYEEDVDWRELASLMQNTWSVSDLQRAVKKLLSLVPDQETFAETIVDLRKYLKNHIGRDKLREYYNPFELGPYDDGEKENAELPEQDKIRADPNKRTRRERAKQR